MIVGISVKNFKGIQSLVRLPLSPFQVLVGPNGSGKTTFLEAIDFVKACLEHGPLKAVEDRAPNYRDLTFLYRCGSAASAGKKRWMNSSAPNSGCGSGRRSKRPAWTCGNPTG